jgi:hypothetical protein
MIPHSMGRYWFGSSVRLAFTTSAKITSEKKVEKTSAYSTIFAKNTASTARLNSILGWKIVMRFIVLSKINSLDQNFF